MPRRIEKAPMPWLRVRLAKLHKTHKQLAAALGIAEARVFEMVGGRRAMLPDEILPAARFLEWPLEQLLNRLPLGQRVLPAVPADVPLRVVELMIPEGYRIGRVVLVPE